MFMMRKLQKNANFTQQRVIRRERGLRSVLGIFRYSQLLTLHWVLRNCLVMEEYFSLEVSLQQGSVIPHKGSWLLGVKLCE